uniref:Secreted protein n=1 Tax=Steinernema glaseri TaxID=37863 RepID=A0A1I7Z8M0_9BILA
MAFSFLLHATVRSVARLSGHGALSTAAECFGGHSYRLTSQPVQTTQLGEVELTDHHKGLHIAVLLLTLSFSCEVTCQSSVNWAPRN